MESTSGKFLVGRSIHPLRILGRQYFFLQQQLPSKNLRPVGELEYTPLPNLDNFAWNLPNIVTSKAFRDKLHFDF